MTTTLGFYDSRVTTSDGDQKTTITFPEMTSTKTAGDVSMSLGGITALKAASGAVTIASGAFAKTATWQVVAGEGGNADTLDSVTGGAAGDILILTAADAGDDITVAHATGANKFQLAGAANMVLGITQDTLVCIHDGTNWNELCRALNHA